MSGPYHEGWRHLRVEGDKDAARRFYPLARKVLGYVVQQAEQNGLGVASHTIRTEEGVVITGEVHAGIPRMTIFVPEGVTSEPTIPLEDIVVWARNETLPDGIDAEHPQQVLKPPGGNGGDGDWTTYFFNGAILGYDTFGRRKSVYEPIFPEGLRRAGNLDWCGPQRERIQWYGPSTRYWYDPFVQMVAQYGDKVFMAGQIVLDTEQYAIDSGELFNEHYVLGAGIRGLWLYVVQVQAQNLSVPVPDPEAVGLPGEPYYLFSVGYTPFDIDTVVCRYGLIPHPDGSPGYRVATGSREVLWSGAVARGLNPWFFNLDCTEAVTYLPPEIQAYGSSVFVPSFDASTTQKVLTLTFDEDDPGEPPIASIEDTEVSLAPGGGEAPIAADYDRAGNRVEVRIRRRDLNLPPASLGYLSQRFDVLCGGSEVELRSLSREAPTENYFDTRRWVMWADAREGVLVTRRQNVHFRDPPGSGDPFVSMEVWLEVWRRGALILSRTDGRTDISADNNSFGTYIAYSGNQGDRQSDCIDDALAPMLPLYGWCWGHNNSFVPHQIAGHHAGFCYLPRQPAVMFGYTLTGRLDAFGVNIPSVVNVYADRVNPEPADERLDFDGMDVTLGAVATGNVVVLSAYPKGAGTHPADHVVLPAGSPQLPSLTGVVEGFERYHPVWLLGRPPPPI
ncbi:MAG TPA: hypothetical protein VGK41_01120 [Solirubrobacterales bacterium]